MAKYTHLPIYKQTYELLFKITDLTKHYPRDFKQFAQKIREEVEKLRIEHAASSTSSWVTVSIGVASSNICHDGWKENLLAAADEALYQAKNSGRNQVKVAETVGFIKGSETNKET